MCERGAQAHPARLPRQLPDAGWGRGRGADGAEPDAGGGPKPLVVHGRNVLAKCLVGGLRKEDSSQVRDSLVGEAAASVDWHGFLFSGVCTTVPMVPGSTHLTRTQLRIGTMAATRPPHLAPVSVHGTLRMQAEDFLPTPAFEDPDVEPAVVVKVASALAGAALLFVCKH
jgi:hypothetical protein